MAWSIRNFLATHNLLAVSAQQREAEINSAQTLDTTLLVDLHNVLNYYPTRWTNSEEATGKEEPDRIYDLGGLTRGNVEFSRAQPQHFAFLLAYALGQVSTSTAGSGGYRHTITPMAGNLDVARSNPSFTAAQRLGQQVMKCRFVSCFVDQVKVRFPKDGWAKISGVVKGTGKIDDNTYWETVLQAYNATSLTLASNGVAGSTAAERLSNVQAIKVQNPGTAAWEDVTYTAVSGTSPAVITIIAPGGTGDNTNYRVYYLPTEGGWMNFPERVSEPPLRSTQLRVTLGGQWTGSAIQGGHLLAAELRDLSWTFMNNLNIESTAGSGALYANRAFRRGRRQKLEFDRDFRDFLMKQHLADNDTLVVHLKSEGPEYAPGYKYTVEIVFPKVGIVAVPTRVAERRLAESIEFAVLEDDSLGSVIVYVQNQVSGYGR
ncbi:MAG: hypothetical protein JRI57_00040 [Deltaproteobacteria bacterium]|nr:hypothetical protein [Deltaproteobacteria bacterium]MBW1951460.1 hypothetical protein [Deltaproteobacteria bacterium]MBW1986889.1 hypothetical protein [Deltaproteobacteria bacterium]MBW2134999.1 hypothetical protein [Deltaproteobacteria bacterium]